MNISFSFTQVTRGVLYASEEAEGTRLRNPFDTITEGIGINRLTHNFSLATVDAAFKGELRGRGKGWREHSSVHSPHIGCKVSAEGGVVEGRGNHLPGSIGTVTRRFAWEPLFCLLGCGRMFS